MNSSGFIRNTTAFVGGRETVVNIKLVMAALYISEMRWLSCETIRTGLSAYELECRERKEEFLYDHMSDNHQKKIAIALRHMNMVTSNMFIEAWLNHE